MKKDERFMRCALWAAGVLPVLWLAMAFAQPMQESGLSGRLEALSVAMEAPFALVWTAECPRVCALFGLLYLAAGVAVEGTQPKLRSGVEHGSARWGDAWELNARFAQRGMENVLLTRNVRLGLYMYAAIAPIPLAAFAGESTTQIGMQFLKSYAGVCLQGAIIVLACVIFTAFAAAPPAVTRNGVVQMVWNYIAELVFNLLVLVGAVKLSERLCKEMLGL